MKFFKEKKKLDGWKISLIIIGLCIVLLIFGITTIILRNKSPSTELTKKENSSGSNLNLEMPN